MSSFVRRLQIRSWKRMAKKPFNHDGKHGGHVKVTVPGTLIEIKRTRFQWPLRAGAFIEEEV